MIPAIRREYNRLRSLGYASKTALHHAKVLVRFKSNPNVRLTVERDEIPYDDSYLDTWGLSPSRLQRAKKELWQRIDNDGVWNLMGKCRCPHCGNWEVVDSVCGFIGDDWRDSGYDADIMQACLNHVE